MRDAGELDDFQREVSRAVDVAQRRRASPPAPRAARRRPSADGQPPRKATRPSHNGASHRARSDHTEPNADEQCASSLVGSTKDDGTTTAEARHDAERNAVAAVDALDHDGSDWSQDGVASAFARAFHGRLVFDHTAQKWFLWRNGGWHPDTRSWVFHAARVFCRRLRDSTENAPRELSRIAYVTAIEKAVRADPTLAVNHEVWDRDPWLLGVPGGVVDLRDGTTRPADPKLYIRRRTSVAPAERGTPAPLWSAFLSEATLGDPDLQAFLQRLAGYCLTGHVNEEVVTFFYGPGGNGKGVFLSVLTGILNDYAVPVPIDVFTPNSRLNPEYWRSRMAGARLVTASEPESGMSWSESLIKELTGNETPLPAREPHGKPFSYLPVFKLLFVGNHAPKLKARTPAMERRLRVVPFDNEPAEPDHDLKSKLRGEHPAILRWFIDGCVAWRHERLGTAAAVARATSRYFERQDTFRHWLEERCLLGPELSVKPGLLSSDFNAWRRENGEAPVSGAEFRELVERTNGLRYATVRGVQWIRGIGLRPPQGRGDDGL